MDNVVKLPYISRYQFLVQWLYLMTEVPILDIRTMTKVKHIFCDGKSTDWKHESFLPFKKHIYVQAIKIRAYNTFNKNNKSVKHCANNPIKTETAYKNNKIFLSFVFMTFIILIAKLISPTNIMSTFLYFHQFVIMIN